MCPVKINIPRMLLKLRSRLMESPSVQERKLTHWEKLLAWCYYRLMSSPATLSTVHRVGRLAQIPVARSGKIRSVPIPPFSRWTRDRDLPALPARSFHQIWDQELSREE